MKEVLCVMKAVTFTHGKRVIIVLVTSLIIGVIFFNIFTPVFVSRNSEVYVVFKHETINYDIYEKLTDEEADQVIPILNGHLSYDDSPSCGFDDNIALIVGNKRFCVARDNCATIRCNGKYFNITKSQIKVIRDVMRNHGAFFPCV